MNSATAAATGAAFQKIRSLSSHLFHDTLDRAEGIGTSAATLSAPASSAANTGSLRGFQIGQSEGRSELGDTASASVISELTHPLEPWRTAGCSTGSGATGTGSTLIISAL